MAALAADRNTPSRSGDTLELGVATNIVIFEGALVAANSGGFATPGAVATTLKALGRADQYVNNNPGANGAKTVKVCKGIFRWGNSSAGDAIANSDIGATCYIVDDQTVAKTDGTGTRSAAGKVFFVDADGVWVDMR